MPCLSRSTIEYGRHVLGVAMIAAEYLQGWEGETVPPLRARPLPRRDIGTAPAQISALSAFTGVLADNGIAISMDGKGAWRDNVFVERLWRSVKYEEVYLRAYESVSDARASIGSYLSFYNGRRPHSSLDGMTPDRAYCKPLPLRLAA